MTTMTERDVQGRGEGVRVIKCRSVGRFELKQRRTAGGYMLVMLM